MEKDMRELHIEGVAIHDGSERCVVVREGGCPRMTSTADQRGAPVGVRRAAVGFATGATDMPIRDAAAPLATGP
jgi:hypothetical protein